MYFFLKPHKQCFYSSKRRGERRGYELLTDVVTNVGRTSARVSERVNGRVCTSGRTSARTCVHLHVHVFCTFWLRSVLRATATCTFSTSQLPNVVRSWCALYILTWKCASRHYGVHFFICHLASWLRIAWVSLLFHPPEPQIIGKTQWLATVPPFRASASSFFWSFLFWLFSPLLFNCPYCRKFHFKTSFEHSKSRNIFTFPWKNEETDSWSVFLLGLRLFKHTLSYSSIFGIYNIICIFRFHPFCILFRNYIPFMWGESRERREWCSTN